MSDASVFYVFAWKFKHLINLLSRMLRPPHGGDLKEAGQDKRQSLLELMAGYIADLIISLPIHSSLHPCPVGIFRHLKLELLTQFPASNDEKYFYLRKNRHLSN